MCIRSLGRIPQLVDEIQKWGWVLLFGCDWSVDQASDGVVKVVMVDQNSVEFEGILFSD